MTEEQARALARLACAVMDYFKNDNPLLTQSCEKNIADAIQNIKDIP